MLWMAVVRSPYAHARITSVDLTAALEAEGVVAAFSGAELADDWAGALPCAWPVTEDSKHARRTGRSPRQGALRGRRRRGRRRREPRARARTPPSSSRSTTSRCPRSPTSRRRSTTARRSSTTSSARTTATPGRSRPARSTRLFAEAAVTVKERYRQQRLIPNAIEPRGVLVQPSRRQGEYTLWSATQIPHIAARDALLGTTGIPETKLRVIAPDVGGGFGSKLERLRRGGARLALARRLGRPVKWIEERSEDYLATIHGRDVIQEIELAATADGKITAVRARLTAAMGAYLQLVTPGIPLLGAWLYARLLRRRGLRLRVHRRLHEHDADRRLPRRRPARGDVRDRAGGGRARAQARTWTRSSSAG